MRGMHVARAAAVGVLMAVLAAGCSAKKETVPPGTAQADQFLFEKGEAALKDHKWASAREYYRQIVDNYPQSTYRPDAKLAVGDTYLGEDSTESLLLAINEYREFLTFYPTNPRADYAQLQLATAHTRQMLRPERDQSSTRDAVKELNNFIERYPHSPLMPDAQKLLRESKDRLSEASYRVGFYYYRVKWWPGAIARFREVLKDDPQYTGRDAVYYYLAEALAHTKKEPEALPYFERVVSEFEQSEYLERAKKRIVELKATVDAPPPPATAKKGR